MPTVSILIELLTPNWPEIKGVTAVSTTRQGGVSIGQYQGLNLGDHVGDNPQHVAENRRLLAKQIGQQPAWLSQTHSCDVINLNNYVSIVEADAAYSASAGQACTVMTADCLPVLIASCDGQEVAAVHAGWRGLSEGIIEAALARFNSKNVQVWLGPCIGFNAFEVGEEMRAAFPQDSDNLNCFKPNEQGRWQASLAELARMRLQRVGISAVYGGEFCSYSDPQFYSHRQASHKGETTGRMASLIWRD